MSGVLDAIVGGGEDTLGFLGSQFSPSQRTVSGVPAELQQVLQDAGINLNEIIRQGGSLPQFGGSFGSGLTEAERAATQGVASLTQEGRTLPNLGDFESISGDLRGIDPGDQQRVVDIIGELRNSGADLSTVEGLIESIGKLSGPDFSSAESILGSLQGIDPDVSRATGAADRLTNLQGPDTSTAAGLLQSVARLATSPEQQRVTDALLPSLETAAGAPRFDLTDTFQQALPTFQADLDDRLADIKAESSALGLGAGSTDRNRRLAETAARETSRFRLGQLEQERESFESAEGRRIGALGAGRDISEVLGRPAETLASLVPAALQTGAAGAEFEQRGLASALPTLLQAGLDPSRIRAGALSSALPGALQVGQGGADFDLNALLGSLSPAVQAALGLGNIQQAGLSNALPTAFQAGIFGPQFQAQNLQSLLNPSLQAAQGQSQFDLLGRQQDLNQFQTLANFGTTERGFTEDAISRAMAEFARTQTGGFDILTRLLAATPGQTTAFGPSNISQGGDIAAGIVGLSGKETGGGVDNIDINPSTKPPPGYRIPTLEEAQAVTINTQDYRNDPANLISTFTTGKGGLPTIFA